MILINAMFPFMSNVKRHARKEKKNTIILSYFQASDFLFYSSFFRKEFWAVSDTSDRICLKILNSSRVAI